MANTITSADLGQDQTNQLGPQNQPGQSNSNQAGQTPVQQGQGNAPAVTSGTNQPNNPNKQQGSGYTNIQKVIQANQGNQLGSAVGNNIQQVGNAAQQNLTNAQNQFQQGTQANQANTQQNQQLVQNVLANPTQYAGIDQTNPNSQGASQFQNLISGQYQGPQGLQNAGDIQNQAANVGQMGQALSTAGGRIGLLRQLSGGQQYGTGEANLDNLLLGQSNDPSLQAAKRQALTLQGQVGSAIQGAAAQGQQAQGQAQQFGQALQNQFGQTVSGANDALQQQAIQAQQGRDSAYKTALADLQSGNITQQEADQLGLTQGENVYNLLNGQGTGSAGANAFLSENPLQANVSNIANAQDYARMQALQKLGGQFAPQNTQSAFANFQNPSQAGSFAQAPDTIGNAAGFQSALQNAASGYAKIHDKPAQDLAGAQMLRSIVDKVGNNQLSPNDAQKLLQQAGLQGNWNQNQAFVYNNQKTAQDEWNAAQQQLNTSYGTPQTINITGNPTSVNSSYPGINKAVSGNQQRPEDLENFPVVS